MFYPVKCIITDKTQVYMHPYKYCLKTKFQSTKLMRSVAVYHQSPTSEVQCGTHEDTALYHVCIEQNTMHTFPKSKFTDWMKICNIFLSLVQVHPCLVRYIAIYLQQLTPKSIPTSVNSHFRVSLSSNPAPNVVTYIIHTDKCQCSVKFCTNIISLRDR
jgi:hypothetical protein